MQHDTLFERVLLDLPLEVFTMNCMNSFAYIPCTYNVGHDSLHEPKGILPAVQHAVITDQCT